MENKPRILVVDDDTRWQEIYREALEDHDYEVTTLGNKNLALKALDETFFHAAIVDLKLGEDEKNRDGLEVLRKIWALDEGTRAVVGSGYLDVSMFDEFQKMGILSLTEIPAEARKQIDAINFYNGLIKKNDPLSKILDTVIKAVEESWRKSIKQQWGQSPFKIIRDLPAKDAQRLLRAGKIEELRPFLSSLVNPLFPWLLPKMAKTIDIKDENGQVIAFETVCWSRSKGNGAAIRFGRHNDFNKSLALIPIASNYPSNITVESFGDSDTWAHLISPPLEGVVYKLTNIKFDEYFEPPIHKRDL
ncbi:MAG: hypothetical protein DCC56_07100 [Anaerolineae bacterium]|nr:MAG: hypothetical protein DCC56_07100 [Anaerolineae bacterium]WKZ43375.1 MAG: response regulator [Anaerolineales bacterium]